MPDVLSWHDYQGDPRLIGSMQRELRDWMVEQGMEAAATLRMGYNEIVDSRHAQSAGYHIAVAAALGRARVDHAALGCWSQPGAAPAAISSCWDGSLDGLLDPLSNFSARPVWHALRWLAQITSPRTPGVRFVALNC